jgi:DNA-directed RNA polymerase subunit RPC12/RpoP
MENQNDELVTCPKCGSDACYKYAIMETAERVLSSYKCFGCGFFSKDAMKEGFDFDTFEAGQPQLFIDLKTIDKEDRVWFPLTVNHPDKGTVFAFGPSEDNWQWAAIKNRPLTEEEQKELVNKGITHKSDASTLKYFQKDFIEACDYIGYFD